MILMMSRMKMTLTKMMMMKKTLTNRGQLVTRPVLTNDRIRNGDACPPTAMYVEREHVHKFCANWRREVCMCDAVESQ